MTSFLSSSDDLEKLWDQLLCRDPDKIRGAFTNLSTSEQQEVLAHLSRMSNEPGWHPEQRTSARCALEALNILFNG